MVTAVSDESRLAQYEAKKAKLISDLQAINQQATASFALKKNTSNLFRQRKQSKHKIDVRNFNQVLTFDLVNLTAEVEGMITYEDFVKECLQQECLPAVVPELKSITVGGALAGGAIESSSFRHGLVHETVLEFEVLLGDGRVVTCTPDNEHSDLFYGFPNSYGTLGYALKVKIKLIPNKKYVKLTHRHFTDPELYFAAVHKQCLSNQGEGSVNFIDGVIFERHDLYLTQAELVDNAPACSNYQYRKIYYQSIKKQKTDYLTAHDYIWRWDADWFWCSKFFFMQNPVVRLLFGKWLLKSTAYWKIRNFVNRNFITSVLLNLAQKNTEAVIQDVQIPIKNAAAFLAFFQENIGITPIWICPTQSPKNQQKFSFYPLAEDTLYINFGFWDVVPSLKEPGYYNRLIENKVRELEGFKGLYSNVFYTETEFWQLYDKDLYFALKQKYDPQQKLRNLYEKCAEK